MANKPLTREEIELLHTKNHDLKNHLMSMRGYLHILSKKLQADEKLLPLVNTVDSKVEKIAELSNEMVAICDNKKNPT